MKKVILIDGNNLLFRSYYATAYRGVLMTNSNGFPTNALYGFVNMVNKIIKEEEPEYLLVAFDKGKTFRHEKYDLYKAGRKAMPDELRVQFPKAKEVLDSMGIKHFEIENYEADDIIGTISKIIDKEAEFTATIVSSDKDLLQLISDKVDVKLLKSNDFIRMNTETFREIYNVDPIRMIDLKALMGDSSDNIPGVKGIGEKTAINLISKYGSLDNLYKNIGNVTGKTRDKLIEFKNDAFSSFELATIYRDVPLDFTLEDLKYNGINVEQFLTILEELEFKSLIKKYTIIAKEINKENLVEKNELIIKNISEFDDNKEFSLYIEILGDNYSKGEILGVGLYDGNYGYYIPKGDLEEYKNIFLSINNKFTYDNKKNIVAFNNIGLKIKNTTFDLMIAAYLLNYPIQDDITILADSLSYKIQSYFDTFGNVKKPKIYDDDEVKKLIITKAKFIYEVKDKLLDELKQEEELDLFENIEMPLSYVLADMEITGIKVDGKYLDKLAIKLEKEIRDLEQKIYIDAGEQFNIMSPRQLAEILFEKLQIEGPKQKKGRYSTSKEVLEKVIDKHPIIEKILEYRTLHKLYTNYAIGLKNEIREDGRIHTIFTQTLTRTGRLSSICPNLQNIPIRDDYSKLIRKAFVPDDNSCILSSDYSQVELRIFASLSNTTELIEAFKNNIDIHAKTASDIFHVSLDEVTSNMRRTAKTVNFGILYGISSFGLSEDLKVDIKTAKGFMDKYLETYPGIKKYMEQEKEIAYKNGYVKTLMNRKRVIDELNNKSYLVRNMGERIALNTPIQGTSADILKKAMIEIFDKFKELGLKSKMLIQVHDELVFNVLNDELDTVKKIVKDIMENTYKLSVPLKVDIEVGSDWYEAK